MPSPSKIPRPKVVVAKKQNIENICAGKTRQQDCPKPLKCAGRTFLKTEVKTSVQQSQTRKLKKSPLREVNGNKFRQLGNKEHSPKRMLHDRRGISEIKRSEKHLHTALESLKQEFDLCECEVQEKTKENDELKLRVSQMHEKLDCLEQENAKKSQVLESLNRDPVTGEKSQVPDLLDPTLADNQPENTFASDFLLQIADFEASLDDI